MSDELRDHRGELVPPGDRAQVLRDRLEQEYPPPWKPKPGEAIVGAFARMTQGFAAAHSGLTHIMVLTDLETRAETSVWLWHTSLIEKLRVARPRIGEIVAIKFDSPLPGSKAYRYRVEVEREQGAGINWDRVQAAGSADAAAGTAGGAAGAAAASAVPAVEAPPSHAGAEPVQPELDDPTRCATCGWVGGMHQAGCTNDIPF